MATATAPAPANAAPARDTIPINDPWMMEVPAPGGNGEYVLCPPGNYPATIIGLVDIGHHPEKNKDGVMADKRKLVLFIELAKKRDDGKPFLLAERYTWSMSEKANFYDLVKNVTGRQFKEGEKFDPRSLVGLPVMVNVTNTQSGEKTYHNVGTISQLPEGFPAPTATRVPFTWSVVAGGEMPTHFVGLPYIYGKSIGELCNESSEARARKTAPVPEGADSIPF